jgi:hypothetical protein
VVGAFRVVPERDLESDRGDMLDQHHRPPTRRRSGRKRLACC